MDLEQMISSYGKYIYNYALKLTCHPMDAEDIAQETFLNAWLKKDQLRDENAMRKWLQMICYNQFLMKMRQKDQKNQLLTEDIEALEADGHLLVQVIPGPEDEVVASEEIRELQNGCFLAMVRKLTLNQRIAFSMVDMFGMKIDEVAQLLELTVTATKGLLYRARMNIDSFFADHCNLISGNNPCSCKSWIMFNNQRDTLQLETKKLIETLDYREKGYLFNETVRRRIQNLYANMPERKPEKAWYDKVIASLK